MVEDDDEYQEGERAISEGVIADLSGNTHSSNIVFQRIVFHEKNGRCFILAQNERAYGHGPSQRNS